MSDTKFISRHPVDQLVEQHELLSSLLVVFEDLSPSQRPEREDLLRRIDEEIDRHIGTQEAIFYPTLLELKDPALHDRVREAMTEHRRLESLATDLRHGDANTDLTVNVLRALVDRHQLYEQEEIFPQAFRLPRVTLNQLGLEIEERRWREE